MKKRVAVLITGTEETMEKMRKVAEVECELKHWEPKFLTNLSEDCFDDVEDLFLLPGWEDELLCVAGRKTALVQNKNIHYHFLPDAENPAGTVYIN